MAKNCRFNSAVWAKEKAEAKFKVQDYQGAVDCAYFAKGIFPGLDAIDDMLAAYQVHLAAAKKDWPAVLGVDDSANLGEIKKQYKRKAMSVHPDKNSSEAATDAFKFIMEAYEVLSKNNQSALGSSWNHQSQPAAPSSSPNHQSLPASPASSPNHQSQPAAPASSPNHQSQPAAPASSPNHQSQPAASASSPNHQSQPAVPASSSNHQSQSTAPASSSTRQYQPALSPFERPCPRCHKVCFFDTVKRSSITCNACAYRFFFMAGGSKKCQVRALMASLGDSTGNASFGGSTRNLPPQEARYAEFKLPWPHLVDQLVISRLRKREVPDSSHNGLTWWLNL